MADNAQVLTALQEELKAVEDSLAPSSACGELLGFMEEKKGADKLASHDGSNPWLAGQPGGPNCCMIS